MRPRTIVSRWKGRRLAGFLVVALSLGVPAAALRILCVGRSCAEAASAAAATPFCSLPDDVRAAVEDGSRDGRSGELLAVAGETPIVGDSAAGSVEATWPSVGKASPTVPLVLAGNRVRAGTALPQGSGLDDVAPTLARVLGFDRPHPEVRSGRSIDEAIEDLDAAPDLVVLVALKGTGTREVTEAPDRWPALTSLIEQGASTMSGITRSAGTDPVAAMTTIGTGGTPAQHGMTATMVRGDDGALVEAWGPRSPINVIATLGDDLDERFRQRSIVSLIGTQPGDLGLVGGRWYVGGDRDLVSMLPRHAGPGLLAEQATRQLELSSLGSGGPPDLLAVALSGAGARQDAALGRIVRVAERETGGSVTFAIAGTGSEGNGISADVLRRRLEGSIPGRESLIEALAPGSVFVDQAALARRGVSDDVVLRALLELEAPDGTRLFADAFPAIAVSFGRFC